MDLIAGDAREIILAVGMEDWSGLRDRGRFPAYISLGGGMDPTWLDLFARAARDETAEDRPGPFSDAACPLASRLENRLAGIGDRIIERVDPHWIDGVAMLPESRLDRIAARWIDLIDSEECPVDPEEKPMLRQLVSRFARRSGLAHRFGQDLVGGLDPVEGR